MLINKPFDCKIGTDPRVNVPHGVWNVLNVSPLALFKGSCEDTIQKTRNAWASRLSRRLIRPYIL